MPQTPLISVVEDDDSLREAMVGLVESLGHHAQGYGSTEAFLAGDGGALSACVITDIQMPGLSGIDLKLALTAAGITVPVIMVTARPEESLHERARLAGAYCILRKPFTPDALVECLERALRA